MEIGFNRKVDSHNKNRSLRFLFEKDFKKVKLRCADVQI